MDTKKYIETIARRKATTKAREHSYRGDLQSLLEHIIPDVTITNEAARIECGSPDYVISRTETGISIGFIEAKDIGKSLDDKQYEEQFDRYRQSLDNLIITDYMTFRFFIGGEMTTEIAIAKLSNGIVKPLSQNFRQFEALIENFSLYSGATITSAAVLAPMIAKKARLLSGVIEAALGGDVENEDNSVLRDQMVGFRKVLMHRITEKEFSDIYAQTIAYGMFAARLHDGKKEVFTRQKAAALIPHSNPFLRKLFQYISGYDLDIRIEWIVSALAEVFNLTRVDFLIKAFSANQKGDPLVHFYETFLAEYDPILRRSRGVWYTPEPIVKFIVKAVDDVLKKSFMLTAGLADTTKISVLIDTEVVDKKTKKPKKEEISVHKVQILDPATGTGTFLAETTRLIHTSFARKTGMWRQYVDDHLIPRLNGFELLMAPYAMAHLKLEFLLKETGYESREKKRLRVYLTNSLEEHHPDTGTLFASWLSAEANEANFIKRDTPVMAVIGNPPYSRHSLNKGTWLNSLMESYKKEPGTNLKLKERNSKWLNDDYVKFFRYAQHFVDKAGSGIVAFVTNNGYIENPTFRGMRWSLIQSFDEIYVIDLHGNSNVREPVPANMSNENVFDIRQGVSIIIAILAPARPGHKKKPAVVRVVDVYGTREEKYDFLNQNNLKSIDFSNIELKAPYYFFKNKVYRYEREYNAWPSLKEIFKSSSTGYYTSCDEAVIGFTRKDLLARVKSSGVVSSINASLIRETSYRPLDNRFIYFEPEILTRAREKFVSNLSLDNLILIAGKSSRNANADHFYMSKYFSELKCGESSKGSYMFPLFVKQGDMLTTSNLSERYIDVIRLIDQSYTPEKIAFYIYGVLSSSTYRALFMEQIREDFARVPPPTDKLTFRKIAKVGKELFSVHNFDASKELVLTTNYPIDGSNEITRGITGRELEIYGDEIGRVFINDEQYFDEISVDVWNLSIGGYFPAQKWLKDRRGVKLDVNDVETYMKIIAALSETIALSDKADALVSDMLEAMGIGP